MTVYYRRFPQNYDADNYAVLRTRVGKAGAIAHCYGRSTAGDGGEGAFTWHDGAAKTDNDGTVLAVFVGGVQVGYWERADATADVDPRWFGAVLDGSTNTLTQLQAAVAAAALRPNKTVRISGPMAITTASGVIAGGVTMRFEKGGYFTGAGLPTLNNQCEIDAGPYQIFDGRILNYGVAEIALAEWWGVTGWFGSIAGAPDMHDQLQNAIDSVMSTNTQATRELSLPRGYIVWRSTLVLEPTVVGYAFNGWSLKGRGRGIAGPQWGTGLVYDGPLGGDALDIQGPSGVRFDDLYFYGGVKCRYLVWLRPRNLANAGNDVVFRNITLSGVGDTPDATALMLGDPAQPSVQISEVTCEDCHFIGPQFTAAGGSGPVNPATAWKTASSGNVKNFAINNSKFGFWDIAIDWSLASGALTIGDGCTFQSNIVDVHTGQGCLSLYGVASEGSDKAITTTGSGANPQRITLDTCSFAMSGREDYPIEYQGQLSLRSNTLTNGGGVSTKEFRILMNGNVQYAVLDSSLNHYARSEGLPLFVFPLYLRAVYSPVDSPSANDAQAPEAAGAKPMFRSFGDTGSDVASGNNLNRRNFPHLCHPAPSGWAMGPDMRTRADSGGNPGQADPAGVAFIQEGSWSRFDVTASSAFTAAALTQTINLANIWARTRIEAVVVDVRTAVTGPTGPITFSVGTNGDPDGLIVASAAGATGQFGLVDADLGVFMLRANAVQAGKWLWNSPASAPNPLTLTLTAASNLGNGTISNCTAGLIKVWIKYETLPTWS